MNLKIKEQASVFSFIQSFPFHLSVGGIVVKDNHILLQYKKSTGTYRIPSETPGSNDTIFSVIERLGREELGLQLVPIRLAGCDNSHTFKDNNGRIVKKITLYFQCKILREIPRIPLDYELEKYEFHWLPIKKAIAVLRNRPRREDKFITPIFL